MVVTWEDPPRDARETGKVQGIMRSIEGTLRANPGKWALLADRTGDGVLNIRGTLAHMRLRWPEFEFTQRGRKYYVRFRSPVDNGSQVP